MCKSRCRPILNKNDTINSLGKHSASRSWNTLINIYKYIHNVFYTYIVTATYLGNYNIYRKKINELKYRIAY